MHAVLSPSKADRWLHCTPSAIAEGLYKDTETTYQAEGTEAHEYAAEAVLAIVEDRKPKWPGDKAEMIENALTYAGYIEEVIATAVEPVVLVEQKIDFSGYVPGGFGTADCIVVAGDTVHVFDYKYGKGVLVEAKDNAQMQLYALGTYLELKMVYKIKHIVTTIVQPRKDNISSYRFTIEDLLAWGALTVAPRAELASKGEGDYLTGDWCKFCKKAGDCPKLYEETTAFIESLGGAEVKVPTLAPYQVAEVLKQEKKIKLLLDKVRAKAEADLIGGAEIEGLKLVSGKSSRSWTNQTKAEQTVLSMGYEKADIYEPPTFKSVAKLEKVVGKTKFKELEKYTEKTPGKPTVALSTDARPEYVAGAEFDILD